MKILQWLWARCAEAGPSGQNALVGTRRDHTDRQHRGRTRLSIVCRQADLPAIRRRMHAVLREVGAEVASVEVTSMAGHDELFNLCFTVVYPTHQRKALMARLGTFADDEAIHRIRFGSLQAAEPVPAA